jgi:hypothetical protein
VALLGAGASDAAAAPERPSAKGLRGKVVTGAQAEVIRRHRLRVRVRARRGGRIRLFATVRRRGAPASRTVVATLVRDVRVRPRRARRVKLRVARAGRRAVSGCGRFRVTLHIARAGTPRSGPGKAIRRSRVLKRDRRRCFQGPGPHGGPPPNDLGGGGPPGTAPGTPGNPIDYTTPIDADRCDFLDEAVCLQPWPNDYFTTRDTDGDKPTGIRLNLQLLSMPRNVNGKPIDPSDYNRNDGFSPGSSLITKIPGLETKAAFDRSGIVPVTDMGRAFERRQRVVVINTRTRARHLVWAELDANPADPANVNLIVRPGENFEEGTRYVVALRSLVNARGEPIRAKPAFRLYRDGTRTTNPAVESRRPRFESMFRTLAEAGVGRSSLYLAWDFTIASERNLSERVLAMRDDAFAQLGDRNLADLQADGSSPAFTVTQVTPTPDDADLDRIVEGTYTVPCYLDKPGCPAGSRFLHEPGSTKAKPTLRPIPGNTYEGRFRCIVPKVAAANGGARPSLYGHGLFGSRSEVTQQQLKDMAQEHNFVFCATEWIGMACADAPTDPERIIGDILAGRPPPSLPDCDLPNVAAILNDVSNFPTLTDRVQQGMLNFTYLGRTMLKGMNGHPAFQTAGGAGILDTRRLFYDGNSQGGIIGGALIAIEPDLNRGVIGVPGMNYSTLLTRSTDFGTGTPPPADDPTHGVFAFGLYNSYPNEIERPLVFALIQTLWDRGEANGYAHHMTGDPLPNTPAHRVLMHAAMGDWQVAQVAAEAEARTIGASTHAPYLDAGRSFDVRAGYGIPRIASYPFDGSALMMFDSGPPRRAGTDVHGTNPPPPSNTNPPSQPPPPSAQQDPHEMPRRTVHGRRQKSAFLSIGGRVIDVCGGRPCYSDGWGGP